MISQDLRDELHEQLVADRQRLEREISNLTSVGIRADTFLEDEETDAVDQHPADDGTEMFEREKNLTVRRALEEELVQVNDALRKFQDGTYGICANCGKPIAEKRLRALPAATHCIDCQAKLERQGRR